MATSPKRNRCYSHFFTANRKPADDACACRHALESGIFADLKAQDDDAIRPIHALVERFL